MKINDCPKCDGEGWLWGFELENPPDLPPFHPARDQRYACDRCGGEPDREVVYQGFDPRI